MHHAKGKTAKAILRAHGRRALALLLALLATFSLLLVSGMGTASCAAAVDENGREVFCGHTAHRHTEECWTVQRRLVCPLEECEAHTHTDECWGERSVLVCSCEEGEGHTHGDSCYTERSVLVCAETDPEHVHTEACYSTERVLSCGLEERPAHTHTAECYASERVLVCGLEEREGHSHSEECWVEERILNCGMEEHEHTLECYSDRSATESRDDWKASVSGAMTTGRWDLDLVAVARTQIGYRESSRNYVVRDGVVHGYTRYGDWIDSSELVVYGPWCASFAAFCIYYANIRNVPLSSNCAIWVRKLIDAGMYYDYGQIEPRAGDLVFFYSGREKDAEQHRATHVGIVAEVREKSLVTIEGNVGSAVSWHEYESTDHILGFGRLPDNPDYRSVECADGQIRLSGVLPADVSVRARALSPDELGDCELPEGNFVCAYEIALSANDKPYKPQKGLAVELFPGELPEGKIRVVHLRFNDKGKAVENWPVEGLRVQRGSLSYTAFSLSRCVVIADDTPIRELRE